MLKEEQNRLYNNQPEEMTDKRSCSPVVVIDCNDDNDDNDASTNTNNYYQDINKIEEKLVTDINNITHYTRNLPTGDDDNQVVCLVKINDFTQFLNNNQEYETGEFEFYLPKWEVYLIAKVSMIPEKDNFSVKVTFSENANYAVIESMPNSESKAENEFSLLKDEDEDKEKMNKIFGKNKSKKKKKEDDENNKIYRKMFSKDLQKKMEENDINFEISYGIYTKAKNYFTKSSKEKLKLNETNTNHVENYYDYESLLYEKLIDPFIFRIRLIASGKPEIKCYEYNGVCNEGNTCYAGSILQLLYNINVLRKAVYNIPSAEDSPLFSIQKIFYSLQNDKSNVKILHLFKNLGWGKGQWNTQQDAQEFLSMIYDIISESETIMMGDSSVIAEYCEGSTAAKISCIDIPYESSKSEKFHFLQLDIENSFTLIECIEKYVQVETMTGENRYKLDDNSHYDAIRNVSFDKIPQILFVQLKRFKYDQTNLHKLNTRLEYPEKLEFVYFASKVDENFKLFSVVVHEGTISSGHFYVLVRDFTNQRWIKFNDTKITVVDEKEVFEHNFGGYREDVEITDGGDVNFYTKESQRTAYILVYIQESRIIDFFKDVTKEDIPESLMQILVPAPGRKAKNNLNNITNYYPANKNTNIPAANPSRFYGNPVTRNSTTFDYHNPPNYSNNSTDPLSLDSLNHILNIGNGNNPNKPQKFQDRPENVNKNSSFLSKTKRDGSKHHVKSVLITNTKNSKLKNQPNSNSHNDEVEIVINTEPSSVVANSITTMKCSNNNIFDFCTRKDLKREFTFNFVNNKSNLNIAIIKITKQLDKKITAISFIDECYKLVSNNSNKEKFTIVDIKLVMLNKMGILIKIFEKEDEDITDILLDFQKKKIYLCFYVMDIEVTLNRDSPLICFNFMRDDFKSDVNPINILDVKNSSFIPRPPLIFKDEEMKNDLKVFKAKLDEALKGIFPNMTEQYKTLIIENQGENLNAIEKYTSIKTSDSFGEYEMAKMKINNSKNIIIRIALESTKCFYS